MASTAASIRVVKRMTYRGVTKDWSNRYHFDNGAPADAAKWLAFSDAVVTAEKAIITSTNVPQTIIGTVGYAAGSEIPVYSKTYSTAGTLAISASWPAPGDCAVLVRYSTSARTSKNHPLYLFNYYHGAIILNASSNDTVMAAQVTAMNTYAAAWIAGFSDGAVTHHRCGPQGDLATGYLTSTEIKHRDFPRA